MSGLKKHIYEEKNGLHYTLNGDYYLPDLKLPEKVRTDAPGIFKRSPPSQIEYIDPDRGIMDISCRPERTGTEAIRYNHRADESC